MTNLQLSAEMTASGTDPMVIVIVIALIIVIAANTALFVAHDRQYRWWYGLIKLAFYFGSFAISISMGGIPTAIASISTFLGMELNKLAQLLHIYGIIPKLTDALRISKAPAGRKDTAER